MKVEQCPHETGRQAVDLRELLEFRRGVAYYYVEPRFLLKCFYPWKLIDFTNLP